MSAATRWLAPLGDMSVLDLVFLFSISIIIIIVVVGSSVLVDSEKKESIKYRNCNFFVAVVCASISIFNLYPHSSSPSSFFAGEAVFVPPLSPALALLDFHASLGYRFAVSVLDSFHEFPKCARRLWTHAARCSAVVSVIAALSMLFVAPSSSSSSSPSPGEVVGALLLCSAPGIAVQLCDSMWSWRKKKKGKEKINAKDEGADGSPEEGGSDRECVCDVKGKSKCSSAVATSAPPAPRVDSDLLLLASRDRCRRTREPNPDTHSTKREGARWTRVLLLVAVVVVVLVAVGTVAGPPVVSAQQERQRHHHLPRAWIAALARAERDVQHQRQFAPAGALRRIHRAAQGSARRWRRMLLKVKWRVVPRREHNPSVASVLGALALSIVIALRLLIAGIEPNPGPPPQQQAQAPGVGLSAFSAKQLGIALANPSSAPRVTLFATYKACERQQQALKARPGGGSSTSGGATPAAARAPAPSTVAARVQARLRRGLPYLRFLPYEESPPSPQDSAATSAPTTTSAAPSHAPIVAGPPPLPADTASPTSSTRRDAAAEAASAASQAQAASSHPFEALAQPRGSLSDDRASSLSPSSPSSSRASAELSPPPPSEDASAVSQRSVLLLGPSTRRPLPGGGRRAQQPTLRLSSASTVDPVQRSSASLLCRATDSDRTDDSRPRSSARQRVPASDDVIDVDAESSSATATSRSSAAASRLSSTLDGSARDVSAVPGAQRTRLSRNSWSAVDDDGRYLYKSVSSRAPRRSPSPASLSTPERGDARRRASGDATLLLIAGIEPNPGPPKSSAPAAVEQPRQRTPDERRTHALVYGQMSVLLDKAAAGDQIHVLYRIEKGDGAGEQRQAVLRLIGRTGAVVCARSDFLPRNQRVITEWKVEMRYTNRGDVVETQVFPPAFSQRAAEHEDLVTFIAVSKSDINQSTPMISWQMLENVNTSMSLDHEAIATERELADANDKMQFAALVAGIVNGYRDARNNGDSGFVERVWQQFLSVPKYHLRTLRGGARDRLRKVFRQRQLTGQVLTQITGSYSGANTVEPDEQRVTAVELRTLQDEKRVRRAARIARLGHVGKAARTLEQDDVKSRLTDEQMFDKLHELHPPGHCPTFPHVSGASAKGFDHDISLVELRKAVKDGCKGAAPGGSGWTEELLLDVLDNKEEAAVNIAAMITDLCNGNAPDSALVRMRDADLIGIPKPDGGIRPITLGEMMLKVATRVCLEADAHLMKRFFGNKQFGINTPSGCELIVHRTRAFMRNTAVPGRTVCTIDFRNAFNSPSRQCIADVVAQFPHANLMFRVEYAQASNLRVRGTSNTITSSRGTRQGSAGGGAFFCMALQEALEAAASINGVTVMAYMDDVTILANTPQAAEEAVAVLKRVSQKCDLEMRPNKCECWTAVSGNLPTACVTIGEFKRTTCLKLLGARVAGNNAEETKQLGDAMTKYGTFFRRLQIAHGPPAMAILAQSGVPKFSYIARVHQPDVIKEAAAKFDDAVMDIVAVWAGCEDLSDLSRAIASLPVKRGGLGLTSQRAIAQAAYDSSVEKALWVPSDQPDAARPAMLSQKQRTDLVNIEVAKMVEQHGELYKRHLEHGAQQSTASLFRCPDANASESEFAAALRYRLLAPVRGCPDTAECPGCKKRCNAAEFMVHAASCTRVPGHNASSRHAAIKFEVVRIARELAIQVDSTEPRELQVITCPGCSTTVKADTWAAHSTSCAAFAAAASSQQPRPSGPDIRLYPRTAADRISGSNGTVLDVTVTAAECETHRGKQLVALFEEVEKKKCELYERTCRSRNEKFLVLGVSEMGMLSKTTKKFVDDITANTALSRHDAYKRIASAAMAGTGAALHNAERKAGFGYVSRRRAEEREAVKRRVAALFLRDLRDVALTAASASDQADLVRTRLASVAPMSGANHRWSSNVTLGGLEDATSDSAVEASQAAASGTAGARRDFVMEAMSLAASRAGSPSGSGSPTITPPTSTAATASAAASSSTQSDPSSQTHQLPSSAPLNVQHQSAGSVGVSLGVDG